MAYKQDPDQVASDIMSAKGVQMAQFDPLKKTGNAAFDAMISDANAGKGTFRSINKFIASPDYGKGKDPDIVEGVKYARSKVKR